MAIIRNGDKLILDKLVLEVFQRHFMPGEFSVETQVNAMLREKLIRVGYRMGGKIFWVDTNVREFYESSHTFALELEALAQNAARQVYTHLLKGDPVSNTRLDPDLFDPDAVAINALIQLVGGSIIGRNTPVLVPGEPNPWMLNLPAQEKVIPLKEAYFQKPLDWWQRFITFHVGE